MIFVLTREREVERSEREKNVNQNNTSSESVIIVLFRENEHVWRTCDSKFSIDTQV